MNLLDLAVTISCDDKASSQIEGISSGVVAKGVAVGNMVSQGITAAAGAIVDFGKQSIESGMNFDAAMSQVAATMGLTTEDIGELRDVAKEMGSSTSFSATEAAEALNYMALAGYDSETAISMLPNVLNLAAAGGMELGAASDMVTDSQTALGLSLEETNVLVDQMAQTASSSNTSVSELGDAILTVGGTAKNLSGGITEMNTVLGVLADNSIKGGEGGTHLRNIILSLTAPTDTAAKAMAELGISATDADGNMRPLQDTMADFNAAFEDMTAEQKTQALSKIFNKTDLAAVEALLATNADRWDELSGKIDGAGFSISSFKSAFDGVGGSFDDLETKVGDLGISTETLSQILADSGGDAEIFVDSLWEAADAGVSYDDVVSALGMSMEDLQEAFDNTAGAAQAMAETQLDNLEGDVTSLSSAIEGAQIAISDLFTPALRDMAQVGAEGIRGITAAIEEGDFTGAGEQFATTITDIINVILEQLPYFLDIGLQMLTGIIQGFGEALPTLIPNIIECLTGIIQVFVDNLPLIIEAGLTLLTGLAEGMVNAVPVLIEALPGIIQGLCDAIVTLVPLIIETGIQLMSALLENIDAIIAAWSTALPAIITALVSAIVELIPLIIEGGIQLMGALLQNAGAIISAIAEGLPEIINGVVQAIIELAPLMLEAGTELMTSLLGAFGTLGEDLAGLFQSAWDGVCAIFAGAGEFFSGVWDNIQNALSSVGDWFKTTFDGAWDNLKSAFDNVSQFFNDVWNNITSAFEGAFEWFKSIGTNIVQGVWQGIQNMIGWFTDQVTGFFTGIVNTVCGLLGIASPSKVFAEIGGYTVEGYAEGIEAEADKPINAMQDMFDDLTNMSPDINASVGGYGYGVGGNVERNFVFNVTINNDGDLHDAGRRISEVLYSYTKRKEGLTYA